MGQGGKGGLENCVSHSSAAGAQLKQVKSKRASVCLQLNSTSPFPLASMSRLPGAPGKFINLHPNVVESPRLKGFWFHSFWTLTCEPSTLALVCRAVMADAGFLMA